MPGLVEDPVGNNLTYRIIGAAMAVHNRIGPGFKEEVYEKALAVELSTSARSRICASSRFRWSTPESRWGCFTWICSWKTRWCVEVKALAHPLTNDERAQVINYLKATGALVGLLFNFGRRALEYKRIFPGKDQGPVQRVGRDDVRKSQTRE